MAATLSKIPPGVQPQVTNIAAEVIAANPQVTHVWGAGPNPDHNNRRCVDYMIKNLADGNKVVEYYLANRTRLLVNLIIWNRQIMRSYAKPGIPAWTWSPYNTKVNPGWTDPHVDHPHVEHKEGVYVPPSGVMPPTTKVSVSVGDTAIIIANGSLNGRGAPQPTAPIITSRVYGDSFVVGALQGAWAQEKGGRGAWYSTAYLFQQVKPDPKNAAGIKAGDKVKVTASGGLRARILPGGPISADKDGKTVTRAKDYAFKVTEAPVDGWVTGGTNWYSSDYLAVVAPAPPKPTPKPPTPPTPTGKPAWTKSPRIILPVAKVPSPVNYLQTVVRVEAMTDSTGRKWPEVWVMAQDPDAKKNTRFLLYSAAGILLGVMTVKNGGHGATFHAYRAASGALWVWTWIGETGYRIPFQSGKTVSSGTKAAYGTARPVQTHEPYIGWRSATSTRETFALHNRVDFAAGRTTPLHKVSIAKRTNYTQQTWALTATRIYRLMGKTNTNAPKGTRLHILDVFDWKGRLLLDRFDVTGMAIPTTSDEPEGLTFSGRPGNLLAGKREGSSNKTKRSYPIWTITNLP